MLRTGSEQATVREIHLNNPQEVYCTVLLESEGERQTPLARLRQRRSLPPRCVQQLRRFDRSEYLAAYDRSARPTQAYELLPAVHGLIRGFALENGRRQALRRQ